MLDVTSYVRLHTLLHVGLLRVVRSCCTKFEAGQTFSYAQTGATTQFNSIQFYYSHFINYLHYI